MKQKHPKKKAAFYSKQWYVLAYDVRDPKRLQKLHYYLKKRALPLQRSVFLLHKKSKELQQILDGVRQRTHQYEDDVRLYPVVSPHSIWAAGQQSNALANVYGPASQKPATSSLPHWVRTLFGRAA